MTTSGPGMEVAPGVFCLGPWGHTQTATYAIATPAAWVLVDTGWAGDAERVRSAVSAVFGPGARPVQILLTHCHPDHSGAAPALARLWDCPVYMDREEIPIAQGDFDAMVATAHPLDRWVALPVMRAMGRRRREAVLATGRLGSFACALQADGSVPQLPGWQWVATPGHTPGHVSFYRSEDGVLISGDALLTVRLDTVRGLLLPRPGMAGPPWYTTWSRAAAVRSIRTLAALKPAVLLPGHGEPATSNTLADELDSWSARLVEAEVLPGGVPWQGK